MISAQSALMESITRKNPRRIPAERSVSLLHSPRARLQHQQRQRQQRLSDSSSNESPKPPAALTKSYSNSPSSLNPLGGKQSSGESSNAENWFDKSNYGVAEASTSFADNDPPFYMRNSSSSDEQADGQRSAQRYITNVEPANSLHLRTGLLHLGTDASSTEDFRGVIDDLTIENKKLKRRLKKYEKLHDAHLKDEKLFEVRVHGLPPDKKRELEETLRKFATELNQSHSGAEFPENGYVGLHPSLAVHKTASSSTSLQNTDSAYASMSASGQGSAASDSKHRKFAPSARNRHQNIHTYLHHIPEGLLPQQHPESMSERAVKKLVVRRMEQIFAGKGAAASGHQQALQQQDVSQSAARADRIEREAQGHQSRKEGIREAPIMNGSDEEPTTQRPRTARVARAGPVARTSDITSTAIAQSPEHRSLEQRPTRPLDLDPHRAQVPAENLRYIRHLGFELPDPEVGSPIDDQGWIYLNLLVNMAQLHTFNVTSDFVRKALEELSDKLEMSSDGRKVRWKGGTSLTRTSSHGGDSSIDRTDDDNSRSPRKRVKLSTRESTFGVKHSRSITGSRRQQSENERLAYTPMFFHKDSTDDGDSSSGVDDDDDEDSFPYPRPVAGDSSAMTSSGVRTTSGVRNTTTKNKKKHDDGPIIFYNNARFCTDLSGDVRPALSPGAPIYKAAGVAPIGAPGTSLQETYFEKRGPLAEMSELPEPMNLTDNPIPDSLELSFADASPTDISDIEQAPVDFEVTGIGGVYPADHFAIAVESRHIFVPEASQPTAMDSTHSKALPPRLAKFFNSTGQKSGSMTGTSSPRIIARRKELPPSALPPALCYMATESDSFSDDGSDADDRLSISSESLHGLPSLAAPQQLDLPYIDADGSDAEMENYQDEDEDDSAASSDGSLDLLAAVRELDPEAVRAVEREYDANMAERLAEEIPAGSSAATAGGGSGFASPASVVGKAMYHKARNEARAKQPSLYRRETTDSMAVGLRNSSNEDEDDDEDDEDDEDVTSSRS